MVYLELGPPGYFLASNGLSSKVGKSSFVRKSEAARLHNRRIFILALEWSYARDYSEPISSEMT